MQHWTRWFGLDACKAGWCLVAWDGRRWQLDILTHIAQLPLTHDSLALIDIPIGLPEQRGRECDKQARQRLSPYRHSSVFNTPCRAAVYCDDYQLANQLNRQYLDTGLSKQSFNISAKIRQVDTWLRQQHISNLREAHPEVCFAALNQGLPMRYNKKTEAGQTERLSLLSHNAKWAQACLQQARQRYPNKQLATDDVLDAIVLCVSASFPLQCLPAVEQRDNCGLRMEIVYPASKSA
jgi:predicted RNase H-like nuclease